MSRHRPSTGDHEHHESPRGPRERIAALRTALDDLERELAARS
jgi:hypothetical protein